MAPYCKDEEKYKIVDDMIQKFIKFKDDNIKIDGEEIKEILTVNGIRFSLGDGSWGLIRASSNKPNLVIVCESTTSYNVMKEIFYFIDNLLKQFSEVGPYDQSI